MVLVREGDEKTNFIDQYDKGAVGNIVCNKCVNVSSNGLVASYVYLI